MQTQLARSVSRRALSRAASMIYRPRARPIGRARNSEAEGYKFEPCRAHQPVNNLQRPRPRPLIWGTTGVPLAPDSDTDRVAARAPHLSSVWRPCRCTIRTLGGRTLRTPRRKSVGRDIQTIRRSFASIARALARLAPALAVTIPDSAKPSSRGPKLRLSAARRAALKLQGQYMGHLRSLKPRQKALRAASGVRPAIALARRLSKR